jgi:hypothetical protein
MSGLKYNPSYQRAIATLAQEFYDYGLAEKHPNINWEDPWAELCSVKELVELCYKVEEKLNYELSWSQCCNAVAWAARREPKEWRHLLINE